MTAYSIYITVAYLIDRMIGDPRGLPHPVVFMGKSITMLEKVIRKGTSGDRKLKMAGILFPIIIAGGAFVSVVFLLEILDYIHPWLSIIVEIWLVSTTIATKGLGDAALGIYQALVDKNLSNARQALSMIVGRDTAELDESEVSRGAIETVSENIVDAIISPLFFTLIGGAPLAMAYRAVNTLDSMVGYKNEKYQNLGWASARLDDIMNYVPARLTGLLIVLVSLLLRLKAGDAWAIMKRDGKLHPSPNSGLPESAVAGALGIQLGGTNFYSGVPSPRAKMGDPLRGIQPGDIVQTVKIMKVTGLVFVAGSLFLTMIFLFLDK